VTAVRVVGTRACTVPKSEGHPILSRNNDCSSIHISEGLGLKYISGFTSFFFGGGGGGLV
jgi:hypothetical protein